MTAPAKAPRVIGNLGSIAPGAGPVVAPDGTVYIGNEQGKLMTFRPDGTPGWSREIGTGHSIVASPAIGANGTIYVIGVSRYTDHTVDPPAKRVDAILNRFSPGGAWLGQTVFPQHNGNGAATSASPNLWRFNGVELVMVPAVYRGPVGGMLDIRLLAFTPDGAVAADARATSISPLTTGGANIPDWAAPFCLLPVTNVLCLVQPGFTPLVDTPPPFPGVGIFTNPNGGTPFILLSDHNKDLVGLTFSGGTFYENFRVHDENLYLRSAPSFLRDARSIIGVEDIDRDANGTEYGAMKGGAIFSGPNLTKLAPVKGLEHIYATPTRLADGRTILLGAGGQMAVLAGGQVTARTQVAGRTITSAAASRRHLFVSSSKAFQTFDASTLAELARMDWNGGGQSPPVIGPQGHVYAIADNQMFVFPPPLGLPVTGATPDNPMGGVFQDAGIPVTPQSPSQSQSYKPPVTAGGNRLFACEELDGDDCGKGDHRAISLAFCQKQGFAKAADFDVDSRKVKAETLDGRFCSKNKCKVFDEIVCQN